MPARRLATGEPDLPARPGCLSDQHDALARLVAPADPRLRSAALLQFSSLRVGQERNLKASRAPHTELELIGPHASAETDAARFATHGSFVASEGGRGPTVLTGVVPEGVATVTVHYPRTASRGRDFGPARYPSAFTRRVRVVDNALSLTVPRPAPDASNAVLTWRDRRGALIRVVRP